MSQTEQLPDRAHVAAEERAVILEELEQHLGAELVAQLQPIVDRLPLKGDREWMETFRLARELVSSLSETGFAEVLGAVTEVSRAAEDDFAKTRPKRDKIVLSLALYEDERGLSTQTGLSRQRVHEMKCDALGLSEAERNPGPSCSKAKIARRFCGCEGHWLNNASPEQIATRAAAHAVPKVAAAHGRKQLPRLAEATLRAEERKKAALLLRDFLVAATDPAIWDRERLATIIGKYVTQVSRIRKKAADAAEAVAAA